MQSDPEKDSRVDKPEIQRLEDPRLEHYSVPSR